MRFKRRRGWLLGLVICLQVVGFLAMSHAPRRSMQWLRKKIGKAGERFNFCRQPLDIRALLLPAAAGAAEPAGNGALPGHYPSLDAVYQRILALAEQFPELVRIDTIGYSSTLRLPIYAIKISDIPDREEDESAVLFTGLHHAREALGMLMALHLADRLIAEYKANLEVHDLVNELEIWLVPVVNPDGYKYLTENEVPPPFWRKNMRDNDRNGQFDPVVDGVDLNRNYDFNWAEGGESIIGSWFYRGVAPFSENETAALKALAERENVIAGITFHSFGEVVLFPWGNYYPAPDQGVLFYLAQKIASQMLKSTGQATYGVLPLNARVGQSSNWMYARLRAMDYIVEFSTEHFPGKDETDRVLEQGFDGAVQLLRDAQHAGIRGHVLDAQTLLPIIAEIRVQGQEASYVAPRRSEGLFGRFERILSPGSYTIQVIASGYDEQIFSEVNVAIGYPTRIEVMLHRSKPSYPFGNH